MATKERECVSKRIHHYYKIIINLIYVFEFFLNSYCVYILFLSSFFFCSFAFQMFCVPGCHVGADLPRQRLEC